MRCLVWCALLALLPAASAAQQETLVSGPIRSGGFGAPVVKFSETLDRFALLIGGRGGWIINESFVVGGGGYGLTNQYNLAVDALEMGYGGIDLEYVNRPNELVHISLNVLLGGGGARFYPGTSLAYWESGFWVAEPGVNLELNVAPVFRMGFGASYRAVDGLAIPGLSNASLSGWSGNLQFKFGKFTASGPP